MKERGGQNKRKRKGKERGLNWAHLPGRVLQWGAKEEVVREGLEGMEGRHSAVPFRQGTGPKASGNSRKKIKSWWGSTSLLHSPCRPKIRVGDEAHTRLIKTSRVMLQPNMK